MKWLLPERKRAGDHLRTRNERPHSPRWNAAKFDESTGQVYLETTVAIQTSDDRNWARDCRIAKGTDCLDEEDYSERSSGPLAGGKLGHLKVWKVRGSKGARSLQDAAFECVLENIADITVETIECLPLAVLRRLWHAVDKRCSKCFNTWRVFSKLLHQDAANSKIFRYQQEIQHPNCRLDVYTNPLTSNSYDFITSLSITTSFPVPDLLKLSAVTNLGVLEIVNTQGVEYTAVGDRLLRSWHLAAVENGAFSVLRILRLWKHEGLTEKSLAYLNGFLALAIYDIKGCTFGRHAGIEAARLGWETTLDTDIVGLLREACEQQTILMREKSGIRPTDHPWEHYERLSEGANVGRIRRTDRAEFLANRPILPHFGLPHLEELNKTWDSPNFNAFSRIGELRNDTDLIRAGVIVGDQALVGDLVVNPTPMASLRLGKSVWGLNFATFASLTKRPERGIAFVRIKTPLQDLVREGGSHDILRGIARDFAGSEPPSTQRPSVRGETSRTVRNKKRKLDDVLNSFF